MIVYLARAIQAFVMYCVNGTSRSSLLIESTDSMIESTDSMIIIVPLLISIFNQGCCGDLHRPESVQPKSRVQKRLKSLAVTIIIIIIIIQHNNYF